MITIANAQAFWGDRPSAAKALMKGVPQLDYLTLDYLAELSMSILASQREKDSSRGYAADFIDVAASLRPHLPGVKVITNAGGLNPAACAEACASLFSSHVAIAIVEGDDLYDRYPSVATANAYLGASPIVEALKAGADIVITGRVADPSMAVAAARHAYGWPEDDYDRIAAATVAGHLIECGTQATGGFSTRWLDIPNPAAMGYPIVEMMESGRFVVTKSPGSGGAVTVETIKEQLLYEIGDPGNYLSPDATVSFLGLKLIEEGDDRIAVEGARGGPPPPLYKVSTTYKYGFRSEAGLVIVGRNAKEKGRRCGEMLFARINEQLDAPIEECYCECFGSDNEVFVHFAVRDERQDAVALFSKEVAPLITSGPQGVTGYSGGRPKVRPLYSYAPAFIPREEVEAKVTIIRGRR